MTRFSWAKGLGITLFALLLSGTAQAQYFPGAFLWGDGDGNGDITAPDLDVMVEVVTNPGADDSAIFQGPIKSRQRMDLDPNGDILERARGWKT